MSIPYQYCKLTYSDDWLIFEDSQDDMAQQAIMMNEDDIRGLNCDFNYNNYGVFYERIEEEQNAANGIKGDEAGEEGKAKEGEDGGKISTANLVGFQKLISEENLLTKMWQNVEVDYDSFKDNYEDWLEEEVWTYFD